MQIVKQVLYHDFSTLNSITHQEQCFCCVTPYYVWSDAVHAVRTQPSLFHVIWHGIILQFCVAKLLEVGSCVFPNHTYDKFMEEPIGQNSDTKRCCF